MIKKKDQIFLEEAYQKIFENIGLKQEGLKTAKIIGQQKLSTGTLTSYSLNPKPEGLLDDILDIVKYNDGKIVVMDSDHKPANIPALKYFDTNIKNTTPEEIIKHLGYTITDEGGQTQLNF